MMQITLVLASHFIENEKIKDTEIKLVKFIEKNAHVKFTN